MDFFKSAIEVLQTLVIALGAGLGVWGVINLLEGYGNDNPGAKSQGMKQVIRGGVRQLRQMPHTPAHQPAVSFQIPLPALSSPQHGGQTLGYRGLFRNYQLIQVCLTPFSSSIKRLHGLYNNDRILSRKYNWRFCYDYQAIHRSAE